MVLSDYPAIPRYYPVPEQDIEKRLDIRYFPGLFNLCIANGMWKKTWPTFWFVISEPLEINWNALVISYMWQGHKTVKTDQVLPDHIANIVAQNWKQWLQFMIGV